MQLRYQQPGNGKLLIGYWRIIILIFLSLQVKISQRIEVEAMGGSYIQFTQNSNDSKLFEKGFNRYYDILGDESEYSEMTELIAEFILTLDSDYIYLI